MKQDARARQFAGTLFCTAMLGSAAAATPAHATSGTPGQGACDAAALQLSLLGSESITPLQAGSSTAPCADDDGVIDATLPGLLSVQAAKATTRSQAGEAAAHSGVAEVGLGLDDEVVTRLADGLIGSPSALNAGLVADVDATLGQDGPLGTLLAPLGVLGLSVAGVDGSLLAGAAGPRLADALKATLPTVLDAELIDASARAICTDGRTTLSGASNIAGLQVLGSPIDASNPLPQVRSIDTASLALDELLDVETVLRSIRVNARPGTVLALLVGTGERSLYDLLVNPGAALGTVNGLLPVGSTLGSILTSLRGALGPVLSQGELGLPAGLLRAVVTPNQQVRDASGLRQSALTVEVSALGQPVVAGRLATAFVSANAADCIVEPPTENPPTDNPPTDNPTPTPTPNSPTGGSGGAGQSPLGANVGLSTLVSQLALQCQGAPIRLTDVRPSAGRTLVQGVADKALIGKQVSIFRSVDNRRVGTTTVRADGVFATKVALPARSIRFTNRARYYALAGGTKTKALKYARRMYSTRVKASGGRVRFQGYVTLPSAQRQKEVVIQRRTSCKSYVTVARIKPNKKGEFSVSFKAPGGVAGAVYRAKTSVPKRKTSKRLYSTYTLPQVVLFG